MARGVQRGQPPLHGAVPETDSRVGGQRRSVALSLPAAGRRAEVTPAVSEGARLG
mgnify:CR=1 FL=1